MVTVLTTWSHSLNGTKFGQPCSPRIKNRATLFTEKEPCSKDPRRKEALGNQPDARALHLPRLCEDSEEGAVTQRRGGATSEKRGELGNQPDHMCACESASPSSEDPRRKEVLGNQPDDRHICLASARTLEKGLSHKEGATDTL